MQLRGKNVLLLGFGHEGRASLAYVASQNPRSIGIADLSEQLALSPEELKLATTLHLGTSWLDTVGHYDIIIRSPGIPLHSLVASLATNPRCVVTSGTNLFLEAHAPRCIGVTGTKGKSTTTSLIYHVLKTAGLEVQIGGNIGIPSLSLLNTPADLYVLELSSYQLEDCTFSPHGAVFLNLYPEHLDHHGDFVAYGKAKANITRFQGHSDYVVTPSSRSVIDELLLISPSQRITFGAPEDWAWIENGFYYFRTVSGEVSQVCPTNATKLQGPGNQQNILATLAVIGRYPIPHDSIAAAITQFQPLPHRLEEVGSVAGITFINDSISTVPQATINALDTFGTKVKTLILGGYDRGVPFESLANYLASSSVETLILFPPSGSRIQAEIESVCASRPYVVRMFSVGSMKEAVELAEEHTPQGAICLLSPASPSFPLFKNFEERGEQFRAQVRARTTQRSSAEA